MARLVINPDTAQAWTFDLPTGRCSAGGGAHNVLVLEHPSVSADHCELTLAGGRLDLRDLGSTHGTFVEGQIVEKASLPPGATFRVGEIEMRFESDLPVPPPRLPPAARRVGAGPAVTGRGRADRAASLTRLIPGVFAYPFQGGGLTLLVVGAVFFFLLGWLPILGLMITGYLFNYAKKIVASSAAGEDRPPDWPDFTNWVDDVLMPYFHLAALVILTFAPALLLMGFAPPEAPWYWPAIIAGLAYGVMLAPMGMLSLAMFDGFGALNPVGLIWSILRIPGAYLLAAFAFGSTITVYMVSEHWIHRLIPIPVVGSLIAGVVNLYLLAVSMRILGLLYRVKERELGWFKSR